MKKILVAGLGNILMGDEGVGVRLVERLQDEADRFPDVDFKDLGTGGMILLHAARGRNKLILIDCAQMGQEPGALRRFSPEEVRTAKPLSGQSLHEGDVLRVLELAETMGDPPGETVFFGIQPASIEPRESLSPELQENFEDYVQAVTNELEKNAD